MTREDCVKLSPDFLVSEKVTADGLFQVGAEWTNAKKVTCAAMVQMKPTRSKQQEAWFREQLFIACHKMMVEDAA